MTFETRFAQMSPDEYFADPCKVPSLSSSIANVLDSQSPLHAWSQHPRLGGIPRKSTKSLENGSLSHALLLGAGKDIAVLDFDDYRTNASKDAKKAAVEAKQIPVLMKDYDVARRVAEKLRERFTALGIRLAGEKEKVALWTETATNGAKVQCRGMMDDLDLPTIFDLKSARSAHPAACRKHVEGYGYALQSAAYKSAVERIKPELAGRINFVFVFYELEAPYAVTPVRLSGAFRKLGETAWRRSVDRWEECLRTNVWPGYAAGVLDLEPTPWALQKDMERQFDGASIDW